MTVLRMAGRVPLAARIGFTLWMLFWTPVTIWAYGAGNFLWLCNAALFLLLYAVWFEDRLIASSQAGVVVVVGGVWTADLILALAVGGRSLTGVTAYMFDGELPLLSRALSLFHIGLPPFVVWLCTRIGYDRRGVWLQCALAAVLVVAGWLYGDPERNLNYVHAPFGIEQVWLPPWIYVLLLVVVVNPALFLIGHAVTGYLVERLRSR